MKRKDLIRYNYRRLLLTVIKELLSLLIVLNIPSISQHKNKIPRFESLFNEEWRWVRFTTESGLPSNQIIRLAETPNGTVWVCTANGVAWYDGFKWNTIDSSKGLPQMYFEDISAGSDSNIVVQTQEGTFYKGNVAGFHKVFLPWGGHHEIAISKDTIIIHYHSDLFFYINDSLKSYVPSSSEIGVPGGGRGLWIPKSGNLWMNTNNGLYFQEGSLWVNKIKSTYSNSMYVSCLIENLKGSGVVSIGLPFVLRGLWEWNAGSNPKINRSVRGDWIKTMDINNDGNIIAVDKSGEILLRQQRIWSQLKSIPNQMHDVEMIKFRANGDLWVGSKKGLFLFRQYQLPWIHKINNPPSRNRVHEIVKTIDGTLWLGTADGLEIHKPDGDFKLISEINGKPLNEVTGVAEDRNGNIWISSGSGFDGTYRWDGFEWKYFRVDSSIKWLKFHKIRRDKDGRLWFLGLSKDFESNSANEPGAFVYDKGVFTRWSTNNGLMGGRVYAFAEGSDKSLWFGTQKGISKWQNGKWTYWRKSIDVPCDAVFTLTIDMDGNVWFSDRISGLYSINKNNKVTKFNVEDGLLDNRVWDLSTDAHGRLWISTEVGLCCLDHGKWKKFDTKSGLFMTDLWPAVTMGDSVFVGTRGKGLAILNLRHCTQPTPKIFYNNPVVEGDKVFINVTPYAFWGEEEPHDILTRYRLNDNGWSNWSTIHDISINYLKTGNYSFEIQAQNIYGEYDSQGTIGFFTVSPPFYKHPIFILSFASLFVILVIMMIDYSFKRKRFVSDLKTSEAKFRRLTEASFEGIVIIQGDIIIEANQRMCKIFGYDYTDIIGNRLIYFFSPESYQIIGENLRVDSGKPFEAIGVKKNGGKIWTEILTTSVSNESKSLIVAAIRDISNRKLDEEKLITYQTQLRLLVSELVITEEKERRRMAEFLHDIIGQALAFCKIKLGTLQLMHSQAKDNQHIVEVRKLIDQTIENTRSLTFDLSPPILYELGFEPAVESLAEQFSKQHGLEIRVTKSNNTKSLADNLRIFLYQAVRELLINIVKHANAKNVEIHISHGSDVITLNIHDDGKGFNQTDVRFDNRSFGLFNIKERLRHLNGHFEIQSEPERGTSVTVSLPIPDIVESHIGEMQ